VSAAKQIMPIQAAEKHGNKLSFVRSAARC